MTMVVKEPTSAYKRLYIMGEELPRSIHKKKLLVFTYADENMELQTASFSHMGVAFRVGAALQGKITGMQIMSHAELHKYRKELAEANKL